MKTLGHIGIVLALMLISAHLAYCFINESGHGPNLRVYTLWFIPMTIVGVSALFRKHRAFGISLVALSGIGILFTFLAAPMRIMMDYEAWVEAGMPSPNPFRIPIILGFFLITILALRIPFLKSDQAEQLDAGNRAKSDT